MRLWLGRRAPDAVVRGGGSASRYHEPFLPTMNDYLLSFILGIIEGLTEFLPVSSTAHLRISEALLGVDLQDGYWKMFSIVIQLGAILCLPIYFRKRIAEFLSSFPNGVRGDRTAMTHPLTLTFLAFLCTAIPAFLLKKIIGAHLENLMLMAVAMITGGIIMWAVDEIWGGKRKIEGDVEVHYLWDKRFGSAVNRRFQRSFPGTSRSMATIVGRRTRRTIPLDSARVFVPPIYPDDDRRHVLRPAERDQTLSCNRRTRSTPH